MYIVKFDLKTKIKTKTLACCLYQLSKAGDIFALYGDIGSGKTTFARYFINEAIKNIKVPSPSYNLYFKYETKKAPIYHLDAWRIENSLEILNLGIIDYFKESIFLVEWPDRIEKYLPDTKLTIKIDYKMNERTLEFYGNENWKNRLKKSFNRDFIEKNN